MTEGERKIRILVVDDIPETRENLRKLLYFEPDIEVIGAATSGQEGIEMAREFQPDVILMDINMPGVDGITATRIISQELPGAQVIMMSVQGETSYMRSAMLAGARDFLTKPFTSDELTSVIRRVYELKKDIYIPGPVPPVITVGKPAAEGKIVTVYSPKGGAGCSTIATNLAIALREETQEKIALVDTSFQFGDIGVLLNLKPSRTISDLVGHMEELDSDLIRSTLMPHSSGIKVLLAPPSPETAEMINPEHVKTILERLKEDFDYIIVDTSTALQDLLLTIFDISDRIVLLMTLEIPAIKNTRLFFEITDALGYPKEKTLLVINKADRRSGIRAENIEASIRHSVAGQIAMDERTAILSVNQGIPFVISSRNSFISQSVFDLARRLTKELGKEAVAEVEAAAKVSARPRGLFG